MKKLFLSLLPAGLAGAAFAHTPGDHGSGFVQGLWHQVSSADHMLILLGLMIVVAAAIRAGRALHGALRRQRQADGASASAASATKAPQ